MRDPARARLVVSCMGATGLQVRGRALRTLGDTLAPKADTPVSLELSWLVVSCSRAGGNASVGMHPE